MKTGLQKALLGWKADNPGVPAAVGPGRSLTAGSATGATAPEDRGARRPVLERTGLAACHRCLPAALASMVSGRATASSQGGVHLVGAMFSISDAPAYCLSMMWRTGIDLLHGLFRRCWRNGDGAAQEYFWPLVFGIDHGPQCFAPCHSAHDHVTCNAARSKSLLAPVNICA